MLTKIIPDCIGLPDDYYINCPVCKGLNPIPNNNPSEKPYIPEQPYVSFCVGCSSYYNVSKSNTEGYLNVEVVK